jgi:LysM repeat protein
MSTIAITHSRRSHAAECQGGPVPLTRRGRLVVFLCCLTLACLALFALAGTAIGSREAGDSVPSVVVTVQPGDTLWSIAQEVSPDEDPREVIERIEDVNVVEGSLQVGQKLAVPVDR